MQHIVADAAEDGSPHGAEASGAHHDQLGLFLLGHRDNVVAGLARFVDKLVRNLGERNIRVRSIRVRVHISECAISDEA